MKPVFSFLQLIFFLFFKKERGQSAHESVFLSGATYTSFFSQKKEGQRGQAAIMDALFFMTICSGAAVLLFSASASYNSNTNNQIASIYNYEYASTALISLQLVKYTDTSGSVKWLWSEIGKALIADNPEAETDKVLKTPGGVWTALTGTSPTSNIRLCFSSENGGFCIPGAASDSAFAKLKTVYASTVNMKDFDGNKWTVSFSLYY